ncbi:MAG TPA: NrfD/PsrC family molybdoenzyme membrane anchor subunit [Anaerolineales bacterium]
MEKPYRVPVVKPGYTIASVSDKISSIVLSSRTPRFWWIGFAITFAIANVLLIAITWLLYKGIGIWGVNIPVGWAFAISNFVWWIGIGHAGTLISAILLLMRQTWRTSINRFAEAMTLFAVAMAGIYPLLHLGRVGYFYYLFPYPNTMGLWPQFRSPLVWDVFAVTTYALVSLMFWYMGLIPDMATLRDRSNSTLGRYVYGILSMGWRGSARHWHRYEKAYFLMAALATPLVVSVHSIVSMDFAFSLVPGWHSTIFPPYFVAGAVFSGFAMVMTISIPLRKFYHLEDFITTRHLDNMAKVMLAMGMIVAYGYLMEIFMAWYSGDTFEMHLVVNRATGYYAPLFWGLILFNVLVPQALWFLRVRSNVLLLFIISILVNVGMWLERFVIVVTSTQQDFLPSAWGVYNPTFWDWATFIGTIGTFLCLIFLFIRFLPVISIFEMRELVSETEAEAGAPATAAGDVGAD